MHSSEQLWLRNWSLQWFQDPPLFLLSNFHHSTFYKLLECMSEHKKHGALSFLPEAWCMNKQINWCSDSLIALPVLKLHYWRNLRFWAQNCSIHFDSGNHLRLTHCGGLNMRIDDLSIFRRATGAERPEMTPEMEFSCFQPYSWAKTYT